MAAKTLQEFIKECEHESGFMNAREKAVAIVAWNAATKAVEEKFTPHNRLKAEICAKCVEAELLARCAGDGLSYCPWCGRKLSAV